MLARSTGVTNVTGFSFIITLPAATAAELDVVRVLPGPATLAQDRTVAARALGGNQILVTSHDHTGTAAPASFQDGVIAVIRLGVPEDDTVMAPQGTYAVDIAAVGVSRATPGVHYASGTGGQAVLQNYKPQDVNRDDSIDVVDVQMTVNIILALQSPQYPGQGDANEDTNIDVVDVQTIVNCILSSGC